MPTHKLIQISDLHLSRNRAYTFANWQAILTYVNETQPDLVVNTGDYVLDDPEDTDDLVFGWEQMNRVTVPWRSLPGDHDIGGGPPAPRQRPEVPWLAHYAVTEERRNRYNALFGEDHWVTQLGGWTLIGINDLIFESGFDAEAAQWGFLAEQLQQAAARPVMLFMHKPPCVTSLDEVRNTTNAIPTPARQRLWTLLNGSSVRVICTGHLHVHRMLNTMGITVISAPTIMRGDNDYRSPNGLKINGMMEYTFDGEGVEFRVVQPEGIEWVTLPNGRRMDWPEKHADG
ncbi:MAG: metallophosphoesterase [Chloroflexota bacterium]